MKISIGNLNLISLKRVNPIHLQSFWVMKSLKDWGVKYGCKETKFLTCI